MTEGKPKFLPNGDVRVPAFTLPVSRLVSEEAAAAQRLRATVPPLDTSHLTDIKERRQAFNAHIAPQVAALRERFPVEIHARTIGGVPVLDVTPTGGGRDGGHDPERVLINLHGGAFLLGWDSNALIESIPLAGLGQFRVLAVDYRMAPEHRHPAGVEDVAAVYRALLDEYPAHRIGIYGGSAGGVLTAQAAAWFIRHDLPQPGALGLFGAGGVPFDAGESAYLAGYIDGEYPPPPVHGDERGPAVDGYFAGVARDDPSAWPAYHLDVLAHFPPTLIITGTRSMDLSPAIFTNSQLLKAGVRTTLIVAEGMGHCYYYDLALPEARDAYAVMIAFFRANLA